MPITEDELRELLYDRTAVTPPRPGRFAEIQGAIRRGRRVRTAGGAAAVAVTAAAAVTAVPPLREVVTEVGPAQIGSPAASTGVSAMSKEQPDRLPEVYPDPDPNAPPMRLVEQTTIDWPDEDTAALKVKPREGDIGVVVVCSNLRLLARDSFEGSSPRSMTGQGPNGQPQDDSCPGYVRMDHQFPTGDGDVEVRMRVGPDSAQPPDEPQTIRVGLYQETG